MVPVGNNLLRYVGMSGTLDLEVFAMFARIIGQNHSLNFHCKDAGLNRFALS